MALAVLLVSAVSVADGHPFISSATRRAIMGDIHRRPTLTLLGALRGGSDEAIDDTNNDANSEETVKEAAEEQGEIKSEEEDELTVEATDEEVTPSATLDADAVNISADAFIHPAHVGGREDVHDDEHDASKAADEEETFFSAVEDEDEGSTTPVTPDDDVAPTEEDAVGDGADIAATPDNVESNVDADGTVEETEEAVEDISVDEPAVADYVEESDHTRQQGGGFTEDDSAAYVDRMDLADDEGEVLETETGADSIVDVDVTVDDGVNVVDDVVDPLDLGLAQSTREALQREQQAAVAAASEAAAAAVSADDGPTTVQYMITRNMKRVLVDELGYTEQEVDNMKPDVAAVLTSKRLKRPSGGMPDAFYVDGKAPSASKNRLQKLVKSRVVQRVVIPALVVGSTACFAAFTIQPAIQDKNTATSAPAFTVPAVTEDDPIQEDKPKDSLKEKKKTIEEEVLDESRLGAFRPDRKDLPNDLDDTWLDKLISRMLEKVRFRST